MRSLVDGTKAAPTEPDGPDRPRHIPGADPGGLLGLQRTIGNAAVVGLLRQEQEGTAPTTGGPRLPPSVVVRHLPGPSRQPGAHDQPGPATLSPLARRGQVRRRVTRVTARPAPETVQRRGERTATLAKILDAGIDVRDGIGGVNQVGHWMDVWVDIDTGPNPVNPPDARRNSVYGLELEYWEWVDQTDPTGTSGIKPWNDMYAMKPEASTFATGAPETNPGAITWTQAVADAGQGTLQGRQRIAFRDIPGLVPAGGRDAERTLKFRIVFNDGTTRKDIYATQVVRMQNGVVVYRGYRDSVGNKLNSGTDRTDDLQKAEVPNKLAPSRALPPAVLGALHGFVNTALNGTAAPFLDLEMAEFVKTRAADKQVGASKGWMSQISAFLRGDVSEGVAAGQYYVPSIPGAQRYQLAAAGGLLVALVVGRRVERVYFTTGATTAVNLKAVKHGMAEAANARPSIPMRSFAEVPTELVRQAVNESANLRPVVTQNTTVAGKEAAHLRKFTVQGDRYVVQAGKTTGPRIKAGAAIVVDPEIRDVTGNWVRAHYGTTDGFIRTAKVTALQAAPGVGGGDFTADAATSMHEIVQDRIRNQQTATLRTDLPGFAAKELETSVAAFLQHHGEAQATYDTALVDFPGCTDIVDEQYTKLFGAVRLAKRQVGTGPFAAMTLAITNHGANHPLLATTLMTQLLIQPGKGDAYEVAYNDVAHTLPPAPPTFGEVVHLYFKQQLTAGRGSVASWDTLTTRFPDFRYRLRPAYRELFGEDQLQQVLARSDRSKLRQAVPNPDDRLNVQAHDAFVTHAPFALTDFVPKAGGGGTGKFDASWDPSTNDLVITVKVFYKFDDNTRPDPAVAPGIAEGGLSPELTGKAWTPQAKADFKTRYEASSVDAFNRGARPISCVRPGWDDVWATPRFVIQEVMAPGAKHFTVAGVKSFLRAEGTGTRMDAGNFSGVGGDQLVLRQYDVFEKIHSPLVHEYCHRQEITGNVQPAYLLDRSRLEGVLQRVGRIPAGANDTIAIRNLADALKRLSIPSELATIHPIDITATAGTAGAALARAQRVKRLLVAAGVPNPLTEHGVVGVPDGVVLAARPVDPAIQQTYVTNWERFSSAHEFGHMIGLIDEYYEASSDETIKEMISAGWLPPETRGTQFRLGGTPEIKKQHAKKQAALMETLRKTKQESPDFAMTGGSGPRDTSLMSGGYKVLPLHMVTAWDAVVEMTRGLVDEAYWRIG